MSVYIKSMEMPKEPMIVILFPDGMVATEDYDIGANAKAIELPAHGRLIDADAAAKQGWTISRTYSASPTEMVYEVKTMTDEVLPTIIPADKEMNK